MKLEAYVNRDVRCVMYSNRKLCGDCNDIKNMENGLFAEQLPLPFLREAHGLCVNSTNTRLHAVSWMETVDI